MYPTFPKATHLPDIIERWHLWVQVKVRHIYNSKAKAKELMPCIKTFYLQGSVLVEEL